MVLLQDVPRTFNRPPNGVAPSLPPRNAQRIVCPRLNNRSPLAPKLHKIVSVGPAAAGKPCKSRQHSARDHQRVIKSHHEISPPDCGNVLWRSQ
jgi:hypothetical protein